MTQERVTVTGIPETRAALGAFGERAANDAEVATAAAAIVAAAASARAPVRTGALAASYAVSERFVVSDLPYAGPIEYGVPSLGMVPRFVIGGAMAASLEQVGGLYAEWLAAQAKAVGLEAST